MWNMLPDKSDRREGNRAQQTMDYGADVCICGYLSCY